MLPSSATAASECSSRKLRSTPSILPQRLVVASPTSLCFRSVRPRQRIEAGDLTGESKYDAEGENGARHRLVEGAGPGDPAAAGRRGPQGRRQLFPRRGTRE